MVISVFYGSLSSVGVRAVKNNQQRIIGRVNQAIG